VTDDYKIDNRFVLLYSVTSELERTPCLKSYIGCHRSC